MRRPVLQIESSSLNILFRPYRGILSARNAEEVPRIASIKAPPVSRPNNCGGVEQIGDPQSGREVGQISRYAACRVCGRRSFEIRFCRVMVVEVRYQKSACSGHRLREVDLPPQAIVQGEARVDPPGILSVKAKSLLVFASINCCRAAHDSVKRSHVSQEKSRQAQSGDTGRKTEESSRRAITLQAVVLQIAKIRPPFDKVLTRTPDPVVDKLELLFPLAQRAVARVGNARITEAEITACGKPCLAGDFEIRQARGEGITSGGGRNSRYIEWGSLPIILGVEVQSVAEVTEAEVGEQFRAQRIREPRGNPLVPGSGHSCESGRVSANSASVLAKRGCSVVVEIAKAIATEQPEMRARIVVGPNIELVASEHFLSRCQIVVAHGFSTVIDGAG